MIELHSHPRPAGRYRWLAVLLLLAVASTLAHPVVHDHVDDHCPVCLQGSGAAPVPSPAPSVLVPLAWIVWVAPFVRLLPPITRFPWQQPQGRAPPLPAA